MLEYHPITKIAIPSTLSHISISSWGVQDVSGLRVIGLFPRFSVHVEIQTSIKIKPLSLMLLDGTVNHVMSKSVLLPIKFMYGSYFLVKFFVIPLVNSYEVVLGYNWLHYVNLWVD